jgi:hypothetical protein
MSGHRWYETEEAYRRRRERERQRQQMLDPATYLKMGKRALRTKMRQMTAPARRKMRQQMRDYERKARKKTFGPCPTCGRPGGPAHSCRMRFSQRNSERLRQRMDKRGIPQTPLWRGRAA